MSVLDYALRNNLTALKRIAKPSDVNLVDPDYKWGVLHLGVWHANTQMIKFWMSFDNCNVNIRGCLDDSTPLHLCVQYNHSFLLQTRLNIISMLMKAGADLTLRNQEGHTPLTILMRKDDCVNLILMNHMKTLMFENHDLAVLFICSINKAKEIEKEDTTLEDELRQKTFPFDLLLNVDGMLNGILEYII
jgi:ankyrin repeat protein